MKTILFTLAIALGSASLAQAHDFTATGKNGQKLFFNITHAKQQQAEVTYEGSITSAQPSAYTGDIEIPAMVKHNNLVYQVTAIGRKAFDNATSLTGIVLPAGLQSIGDFAFEGCTQLARVVFPGNPVRLGEGIFFRCTAIRQLTLGSDWSAVNLNMFRWSERLTTLSVPAKLVQLQNLKSLKSLKTIEVDINNPNFTSVDGILYSKDRKTLLGCPRGRTGKIRIPEGTETIRWGAFIDCPGLTGIDLPASLKVLSYREFSRLENLSLVIMRADQPLMTADTGSGKVFLLKTGNEKTELIVPKTALDNYKKALCSATGEYSEIPAHIPEGISPDYALFPLEVKEEDVIGKDRLAGAKNFSKYE